MSEEKEEKKELNERVQALVTRNFSITKCPERVYDDFVNFCKDETNDNYSMRLKMLLEARKTNIKEVILYEQYMELKHEFEEFKTVVAEELHKLQGKPLASEKKVPRTFGKK